MKVYLVRHAETDAFRKNRADYGPKGAPLNGIGVESSKRLGVFLKNKGVDISEPVAVSELQRTKQTAEVAGFRNTVVNSLLNEINTDDIDKTMRLVKNRQVPQIAKERARKILIDPPKENYWFTHGLVMAALLDELGYLEREDYVPGYAQVIEVEV